MRRLAALVVLAALTATAACSEDGDDRSEPPAPSTAPVPTDPGPAAGSSACAGEPAAPGRTEEVVASGGQDRTYLRYVPADAPDGPRPLVVDLTAYSPADLQERISGFTLPDADGVVMADEVGAVVVTPEPVGGAGELLTWNLTEQAGWPDDVRFVADLLTQVEAEVCVVPDELLIMGFAIGGVMASRLACTMADDIALLAAVSGLDDPPGCDPSRPVPVLAIHGTADRFLPYDGGVGEGAGDLPLFPETTAGLVDLVTRRGPVAETAAAWAERNGCGTRPTPQPAGDPVGYAQWAACADDATVELVTIEGGEHTWPGSTTMDDLVGLLGPVSDAVDANDLIWARYEDAIAG